MTGTVPEYNLMERETLRRRIERRNGIVVITNYAVVSSTWFWDVFVHKTRALQLRREAQIKPPLRLPPPCWATGTISTMVEHNSPVRNTRFLYLREAQTTCHSSYWQRYRLSRTSRAPVLRSSCPCRERRGMRGLQRARKWRPPWFRLCLSEV